MENKKVTSQDRQYELFNVDETTYGKDYKKHLIAQYKLCVLMADNISSRRSIANNFFLSLNTLLIAVIGILSKLGPELTQLYFWWIAMSSFAGLLFCWVWATTIKCYRELNSAKFVVINAIEKKLPVAAFEAEWECLHPDNNEATRYPQLTRVERWVPLIFALLYITLLIISLVLANNILLIRPLDP